jgi:hypothetical protein
VLVRRHNPTATRPRRRGGDDRVTHHHVACCYHLARSREVRSEGLNIPTLRTGDSREGEGRLDPAVVEWGVWLPAG